MAESESHARLKKTLESSKELTKTTRENVDKERFKILEKITKDIVESKIDEKEGMLKALAELYNDTEIEAINALKLDEDQEKKKLSAEYESIVKKQLQMLQADERGKQALLNEISNIKQEQRKRSEALKARKKALLIEKERSKRIAALPPPLPKSVKLLLKEQDKKEPDTLAGLQLSPPQEQALYPFEEEIDVFEDKENMDDDDLCRAQRKLQQEEWNRKAKKRFNEAIRKDRQKQEHAQILKEIEEAEKTSRRQMARSLTEPGGTVPCPLSDRLNHMEKQAVLEDAVEKVFNKSKTTKEHAIEDLEGYEDKWEAKYKRIDSTLEAKMIDCVPNFLKQNYSYLLEEEPAQPCGNRFGRLNDSSEDLNEAYIESPTDRMSGSDKIAAVLSHLDQMMSESNALLERDFKPLLKAEGLKADQPKVESFDKAVEANILKQPTEDKSTNIQGEPSIRSELPLASTSTQADFMSSGVMAFKRRSLGSRYKPYMGNLLDPQAQVPTWVEPAETVPSNGSWSSSSYRSLPSKFGQPGICQLCDSPSCNLPLVEGHHRDCIPMSKSIERTQLERKSSEKSATYPKEDVLEGSKSSERSQEDISSRSSTSTEDKSNILSFVQIIAQKYLKKHQEELEEQASSSRDGEIRPKEVPEKVISGGLFSSKESESKSFAIPKQPTSNKSNTQQIELQDRSVTSEEKSLTKPEQDQFVQRCHDILSEKLSNLFTEDVEEDETEVLSTLKSAVAEEGKAKLSPGDFVYHELSTILEMDSALTNDMPSLRDASKKTSRSSSLSSISKMSGELISPEEVDTTSASLVDVPVSEAAELAKNIQFVSEPLKSVADPQTPLGLISGNISSFQTPSPQVVAELTKDARSVSKSTKPSELSEPKTPFSRVTGMPTDIQTPSPYVAAEALPRKPFSSEHLTTPSQLTVTSGISTPSILKTVSSSTLGSKDLLTPISQLSPQSRPSESVEVTPYSSSHRFTNLRHPYLTNLTDDLPQYFKDISSIQQENQQEDGRPTVPKTVASDPTSNQLFFPKNFDGKFHTDEDSSSFKPMTPHSYVSSPGALPTDPHAKAKPGYYQPRKESHNKFQREETSSSSYKPMTPYVSSQGALHSSPDNKSKERSPKYNNQATVSSQGSFKPKTPHSYYSEGAMHTEIDNKSKNDYQRELEIPKSTNGPLHSTENTQVGYKPLQSHFLMPSPIEKQGQTDRLDAFTNRYFSNLKASSLQKGHDSQNTNSRNVQPMTPPTSKPHFCVQDKNSHETKSPTAKPYTNTEPESSESEVSTPRTISPVQKIKDWITSPSEGMTPHYCISSPNLPSQSQGLVQESKGKPTNAKAWMSTKDSVDDFQAMAPHSYLSEPNLNSLGAKQSPGKKSNQKRMLSPLQNEQYLSENDGFQPVTLYTYQSTPDLRSQKEKGPTERNGGQESVATENGYQAMTPHSYVSSEENLRSSSSSLKLRLRIPVNLINSSSQETAYTEDGQNVIPSTGPNKSPGFEAKGQNYGLKDSQGEHKAKKVPRSDFFVPQLSPADLDIEKHTPKSKKDAENPDLRNEIVEYLLNDSSNEKKAMKVPRSDFFVPQLSAAELAIDQKLEEDQKSLTYAKSSSSGLFAEPKSTPRTNKGYFTSSISEVSSIRSSDIKTYTDSTPSSSSITSSSVSGLNTRELLTDGSASSKTGYGSVSSLSSGTPNFSVESPNPILEALRKKFALSSSSQASSLYSTPLSTQGPSSDSSVSKISSQSTPLKTIEDIIQETGIMDEPDLTLVTTNLTIKPGSPERTRLFLENRSLMIDRQDQPTQSNNEVTENKAAGGNSYADSPSMMSFLQHENSCLRESNNGGRQFNRNQPKFDYQKRTKRLWNNLEEVKTKKMMEEKKKKIAENRLKMKAYTKVYKKN
ncbi:hypothetical protein JTE90_002371 [Oedothorax gibbosus]|uniref:Uncharacterized protein n=1 Tax=Oedothorax gibbosus TaxID=931172 RepID=A0AAV6VCT9_9ARAC|nr:hypothetical protein JTE90_002371 [Oedothorax gibbosus]